LVLLRLWIMVEASRGSLSFYPAWAAGPEGILRSVPLYRIPAVHGQVGSVDFFAGAFGGAVAGAKPGEAASMLIRTSLVEVR
jgi:hypothetical protein